MILLKFQYKLHKVIVCSHEHKINICNPKDFC